MRPTAPLARRPQRGREGGVGGRQRLCPSRHGARHRTRRRDRHDLHMPPNRSVYSNWRTSWPLALATVKVFKFGGIHVCVNQNADRSRPGGRGLAFRLHDGRPTVLQFANGRPRPACSG